MKASIFSLLILVSLGFTLSSMKKSRTSLSRENLKGRVKECAQYFYEVDTSTSILKKGVLFRMLKSSYDRNGMRIAEEEYRSDGPFEEKRTHNYDANNNMLDYVNFNKDGTVKYRFTFTYDEHNNVVEQNYGDGVSYTYSYTYDKRGNPIEKKAKRDNEPDYFIKYVYDEKNRVIGERMYDKENELLYGMSYKYDEYGNRIEEVKYTTNNTVTDSAVFKFDDKNNLVAQVHYNSKGAIYHHAEFTYEFDSEGNFLKQIGFKGKDPVLIAERTYVYY